MRNVADLADAPTNSRASRTMSAWTSDELRAFLEAISDHYLHPLYLLAATTGMRRAEIAGLVWRNGSSTSTQPAAQGLVLPARPQRTPAPARPLPDWIEWRRHQITDITHFPRPAYAILDVVTRKWPPSSPPRRPPPK